VPHESAAQPALQRTLANTFSLSRNLTWFTLTIPAVPKPGVNHNPLSFFSTTARDFVAAR